MSTKVAEFIVCKEFEKALRGQIVEEKTPELLTPGRKLSETPPFPFSRKLVESAKTVFNFAACDNQFEQHFAEFLDHAEDVRAFAKLPEQFGFYIHYTDTRSNVRHYSPDFVVELRNGEHWLLETKGLESVEVRMKDAAARHWCESVTALTSTSWNYLKILQTEFESLHPETFEELRLALHER